MDTRRACAGVAPSAWLVENMDMIDNEDVMTLSALLPPSPPPGFRLLVRYVDTLCQLHSVPIVDIAFEKATGGVVDMSKARVLHCTRKSLVVQQSPASSSVIKIGPAPLIEREIEFHNLVDDHCPYIRRCLSSGVVLGVSDDENSPLQFLELEGLGERLDAFFTRPGKNQALMSQYFDQCATALQHMHAKGVLHRDVKPSNIMIIDDVLKLNDFDCSCDINDHASRKQLTVGTACFQSPFLQNEYNKSDDWVGLILTFLSLHMDITNRKGALVSALDLPWVPQTMKDCIRSHTRS